MKLFNMVNKNGLEVTVSDFGGVITSLKTKDRSGKLEDIVQGYENIEDYKDNPPHLGALIGRFGNRIAGGKFELNGQIYELAVNQAPNHLHGGNVGFDKVLWNAKMVDVDGVKALELSYLSKDGEEGYPGNLNVVARYMLTDNDELRIDYEATTDKDTVLNLTNHSYFNLKGHDKGSILDHELKINADSFTATDANMIPTGELVNIAGTPLDFQTFHPIGERIDADYEPLRLGSGYDHNYVINSSKEGELTLAAEVYEKESGRVMEVLTTEPGVQLYTANFLEVDGAGKGGASYSPRSSFCLETQHFPDSPNRPEFPSTVLRKGEVYKQTTIYKFSVRD